MHLLTLQEGGIEIVQIQVGDDSPAVGHSLESLTLPEDTALPLIIRDGQPLVLRPDTVLQPDDKLIAVASSEQEGALRQYIGG